MRIALVSYEFPPETLGGIGTYARHTAHMLAIRGHDVTVFSGTSKTTARHDSVLGVNVLRLPCQDRRQFASVAVPALAAEHSRTAFDVAEVPDLYAEGRGLRRLLPQLPMLLRAHTPLYIPCEIDSLALSPIGRRLSALRRIAGGLVHRQPWQTIWREARGRVDFAKTYNPLSDPERQVALDADLVMPPSHRLAHRLLTDWNLPAGRVRVLPYSHTPAPDLLALAPPSAARVVAFHGSVRHFKGVHVLVAAMRHVIDRHPDTHLVLAGKSDSSPVASCSWRAWRTDTMLTWSDTLRALAPQLAALEPRVTIRGFVAPEHLAQHLAEADICVFPSLFDNFPSACLEAMSAARPIIATQSGGMTEMLSEGEAGLLVPPGRVRLLADAICRLIEDPKLSLRLALRARARVTAEYSPAAIGPRQEAMYREAIAHRRAA